MMPEYYQSQRYERQNMDLITTDENQVKSCQTGGLDIFSHDNIIVCEKDVRGIQEMLDKAVANGDKTKIRWYIHLLSKKSRAVKILAIHRICQVNQGRYTAGVDGMTTSKDKVERHAMMETLLNSVDITSKPKPIRRVFIPKSNGEYRPLGIPTINDRIIQEIVRQAIEPICEHHFLPCNHGFRPRRSCHDAIADLFSKLSRKGASRWVVEGDIKGCFDNISHEHIISTLQEWKLPNTLTDIIRNMLEAEVMHNMTLSPSTDGTPQGGVISPMLANVALTCLDKEVKEKFGRTRGYNPIVRYADDFVIIAKSEEQAKAIKSHIKDYLKEKVGLELSNDKTRITEISNGFDFLGFNLRKYKDKLLIKPSRDKVSEVKQKIKEVFKIQSNAKALIKKLNPILIGWGNYYRHVVSDRIYKGIADATWRYTKQWCKRKHPNQHQGKWINRYFTKAGKSKWVFYDMDSGLRLNDIDNIRIRRFIKVRSDKRVYDVNAKEYWKEREYINAKNSINGSLTLTKLFQTQQGRCEYCKQPITNIQVRDTAIHKHHIKPRSEGGDWKLGNLRLLHADCHILLHSMYSRKEMAGYIDTGIDYLRLMKPAKR